MPRVVSLVPSLTETVAALGLDGRELVGRTSWCVHPRALVRSIAVLGGTKTPRLQRIVELRPDLVLLDRDENRAEDARELERAGLSLFVVDIATLDDVHSMVLELGRLLDRAAQAAAMAAQITAARQSAASQRADTTHSWRVLPLVWNEPLMTAAPDCYCGALLGELGLEVPRMGEGRYPGVTVEQVAAAQIDLLLLPSEPHHFTQQEGEALQQAFAHLGAPTPEFRLVGGEDLFWYGGRSAGALRRLRGLARDLQSPDG